MLTSAIIKVRDTLIVSVQEDLGDEDALDLQAALTQQLERTPVNGVLIDLSLVQVIDSFLGRTLNDLAVGVRLLGARAVVVGMQPAVAITLVELGLELRRIQTALTVERGLDLLARTTNHRL